MADRVLTGSRIRDRRIQLGRKQSELARQVGISPSYLNLIEHNRRGIAGRLLNDLARELDVEPVLLAEGTEAAVLTGLREAADGFGEAELDRLEEFAGRFPGWAALILDHRRRVSELERANAALTDRIAHDPQLSQALHEVISAVTAIRSTASILVETEDLEADWTRRFHRNLADDSGRLSEGAADLVRFLDAAETDGDSFNSLQEEVEGFLAANKWHFPDLERALPASIPAVLAVAETPLSAAAKRLAETVLTRYAQDAKRLPLVPFIQAAQSLAFDPVALADQFNIDVSAVLRRLATLPEDRLPMSFGYVQADGAGALTLKKAPAGFSVPRFGAGCPLWPLYRALTRPQTPVRALLDIGTGSANRFLAYAICQPRRTGGFESAEVYEAAMILIPEGAVPFPDIEVTEVGLTCRVCPRAACDARREPSVLV